MKQSILMKTKRSINSIMMMLQLLVMLFAMSLSMSSHAQTGNLTVTRTPSTMIAGQPFTIAWSSTEPTAVATKYSCVSPAGGFAGSASLTVSGSASGTADPNWLWKDSTCTWTVVNAAGSVLASRTDIMKTVAAPVNGVTYIHTDGLGSPVAKSDANGNLIAGSRTRYEPYGMTVAGTATPTIGFTGHVNDADTGLTYMQQRYYDPVAGRFLSTDPVLTDYNTGASFNRYVYANNNPYKYVDPDGRNSIEKFQKLGIKIRNQNLVTHPVTGIPFKVFPDFSKVAIHTTQIAMTGKKSDFDLANANVGLKETPKGYTWHHHEDGKTMQLVPTDIHMKTGHTGGASYAKAVGSIALAAVVGEAGAAVISGEKEANSKNVKEGIGEFLMNLLPLILTSNSAGEGSDKIPGRDFPWPEKKDK